MKIAIFTKPHHVEKLTNYLTQHTAIDFVISSERHELNAFDYDIGISYCFPYIINVKKGDAAWYNFHPAPLPKYKGVSCYADAIKDKVREWSVSLHIILRSGLLLFTIQLNMF